MDFTDKELARITNEVIAVAVKAGEKLKRYQKKIDALSITHKDAQGVVSEADVETEKFIIKKLSKVLKEADFLAEESCYLNKVDYCMNSSDLLWVIDPLDGTTNFLNGMDYFAVCISLCYQGRPIVGVIHRPQTEETYFAWRGGGAYCRKGESKKKKLLISNSRKQLKNSLLVTGFATEKGKRFDQEFAHFQNIMWSCRGIRRMGSAALDLCLVSQGIFDGFWERGLAPWDMAAAEVIARESGLEVTTYEGKKFSIFGETIVCARKSIHTSLVKILK